MNKKSKQTAIYIVLTSVLLTLAGCKVTEIEKRTENTSVPQAYGDRTAVADTTNSAAVIWKDYFADPYLIALIDSALVNNQELNITMQEILIAQSEIRARKGEYLPFVGLKAGAGAAKVSRNTPQGSLEHNLEIVPGQENPEPLGDVTAGVYASWEIDIWNKLHNSKKAAVSRYMATVAGRNFAVTNLIAEIADNYYELLATDSELGLVRQNIDLQVNALQIVKLQKESARVTELAVKRFEAQLLNSKSLEFDILQKITETENRINLLVGRFPQPVARSTDNFIAIVPPVVRTGIPAQLLENRPDVKQAEMELAAAKLDVKAAKASFYPSFGISAGMGYQSLDPATLFNPKSLLYSLAGDITAPLINRNAIKAAYVGAGAKQIQVVYNYERTLLNAYIEVANQMAKINNMQNAFDLKAQQVDALDVSITISNDLFASARADYIEVLLTQRDALESKFELVAYKQHQLAAMVAMYHALGGGWN